MPLSIITTDLSWQAQMHRYCRCSRGIKKQLQFLHLLQHHKALHTNPQDKVKEHTQYYIWVCPVRNHYYRNYFYHHHFHRTAGPIVIGLSEIWGRQWKRFSPPARGSGQRLKWAGGENDSTAGSLAVFSFLYFLKIKISKIYVRFEIFQKYARSPPIGRQALSVNFFLFKFAMRSLKKKGPVAPPTGDRGLSPVGGGDMAFFLDLFWAIRACSRHHRWQDLGR